MDEDLDTGFAKKLDDFVAENNDALSRMQDDVVHVGLNEGRCQFLKPYNNGKANEWTREVPRPVWEAFEQAKRELEAAESAHTAALQALLEALKANPRPGPPYALSRLYEDVDFIVECVVDKDRIYWP